MKKGDVEGGVVESPARPRRWVLVVGVVVLLTILAAPFWGPRVLGQLAFFRVRRIEVLGARFTPVAEILARLRVDTTRSVWDPVGPLAVRVQSHPQVERVAVSRKLPGTLVVEIVERRPVAFVTGPDGLTAVDERGRSLPLDPSRTAIDVPIVTATPRDAAVYPRSCRYLTFSFSVADSALSAFRNLPGVCWTWITRPATGACCT